MELNYKRMGQRIREIRTIRGLSLAEMSNLVGLTKDSYRHIETAAGKPCLQTLFQIANILNVSMDYLTGRTRDLTDKAILNRGLTEEQEIAVRKVVNSIVSVLIHSS